MMPPRAQPQLPPRLAVPGTDVYSLTPEMRHLLSRGALVGLMVLAVLVLGYPAPPQPALLAQSASIMRVSIPYTKPELEPIPRRLAPRPLPTPSAPPQAIAAPVVRATVRPKPVPKPAAPPHVAVGTGQWGLINQDRQAAGLAPLQWNACLANVATGQAARMAAQGYISHLNGRTLDLGCHLGPRTGENIGFQGGGINDAAMNAWFMGDAPHRANILGPYHYVGVAWVLAPNGTAYLAVEFS
jgi:uncharacterized protein YkwD